MSLSNYDWGACAPFYPLNQAKKHWSFEHASDAKGISLPDNLITCISNSIENILQHMITKHTPMRGDAYFNSLVENTISNMLDDLVAKRKIYDFKASTMIDHSCLETLLDITIKMNRGVSYHNIRLRLA